MANRIDVIGPIIKDVKLLRKGKNNGATDQWTDIITCFISYICVVIQLSGKT